MAWFFCFVMYSKVELDHPVFAVLFQEVAALCALQAASFLYVLATGISYGRSSLPLLCQACGALLHQWSWLVVSGLR